MEQANNLEVFNSKHNMGAKYALDHPRGTVTPSPVSAIKILYSHLPNKRGGWNKRGGCDFLEKTSI